MAETNLHNYSVQEKLNKQDVDVISKTVVSTTNSCSVNEVIFQGDELENMVSVKGGTCIIQSISLIDIDDNGESVDLVFSNEPITLDDSNDGTVIDAIAAVAAKIIGVVTINNYFNGGAWTYGHKENIGLALKAGADTKSIYVCGVNRGATSSWTASGISLVVGVIKD